MASQARLVLWVSGLHPRQEGTWALLYPVDSGAFDQPVAVVRLRHPHELPPVGVGEVVDVTESAGSLPGIVAGGLPLEAEAIAARGELGPVLPTFAEARGGPAVHHPDHGDASPFAWAGGSGEHLASGRSQSSRKWLSERSGLRTRIASLIVALGLYVGVLIAAAVSGRVTSPGVAVYAFVGLGASAAYARRELRKRRRVDRGLREQAGKPVELHEMRLRLWFASGDGSRPVTPWATLYPLDSPLPVVSLPLLDVPGDWRPEPGTRCQVRGRPAEGEVVTILVDDSHSPTLLQPADVCTRRILPVHETLPTRD